MVGAASPSALLGRVVLRRLRHQRRSVRPAVQLRHDARLHDRHLGAEFRQQTSWSTRRSSAPACRSARRCSYAGGFYYAIFALHPAAVLRGAEVHLRPAAQDAARCGHRQPRHRRARPRGSTPRSTTCRTASCMFDARPPAGRHQPQAHRILRLCRDRAPVRRDARRELVRDCVEAGAILRSEAERLAADLEDRLSGTRRDGFTIQKQDGRTLESDLPADGKRRLGRADRGRHRAARRRRRGSTISPATMR